MQNLSEESNAKAIEKLRLLAQRKYCGARTRKGTPCKRADLQQWG